MKGKCEPQSLALASSLYITKYLNHMRSYNRGIDESIHLNGMFSPALCFLFVLDRSAPNGAPTFDGRGTLNANEIAATAIASLSLPPPVVLVRLSSSLLSRSPDRAAIRSPRPRPLALGTSFLPSFLTRRRRRGPLVQVRNSVSRRENHFLHSMDKIKLLTF